MVELFLRLICDDSAQDVVEYAYLALFVGLAGIVVWAAVVALLENHYDVVNDGVQGLWEPPEIGS